MTKGLDATLLDGLQADVATMKVAVKVASATPLRYCTGSEPVTINSEVYSPRGLDVEAVPVAVGQPPELDIAIDNRDDAVGAVVLADPDAFNGSDVTVYWLVRQPDGSWSPEGTVFQGGVTDVTVSDDAVTFTASPHVGRRGRLGLMVGRRECGYRFKGPLCQYSGPDTTCTHTWADCSSKGNTAHFGGFRWAPEPGEVIQLPRVPVTVGPGGDGGIGPPPPFTPPPYSGTPRRRVRVRR